jgi:hypothetical protein
MKLQTNTSIEIFASPETVFDFSTNHLNLPKVFTGYGPVPAILKAETLENEPFQAGSIRRVYNADGSVIDEKMIELSRPTQQQYQLVRGFKPPFSWLFQGAGGDWTFSPTASGTLVEWKFNFVLTSPIVYPVASVLIHSFFVRAQQQCLINIKQLIETGFLA